MLSQGHWFGGGFMWLFWVVLAVVVVWFLKASFGQSNPDSSDTALDILKKRFAKGEIDQQEFERKRKELE